MNPNRILTISVIVLIIANIALISFIWFNRPAKTQRFVQSRPHAFHERMMIGHLNFDEQQTKKYQALLTHFREEEQQYSEKIYSSKKLLHESIYNEKVNSDSLLQTIGQLEGEREAILHTHLKNVYGLCDESQKEKFSQLIDRTIRYRGRERQKRYHR